MVDCLGEVKTSYRYAAPGRYTGQPSLVSQPQLCEECNKNQATKIQELNSFEPSKESDFQSELETLKQHLDDRYKLCQSCHNIVKHHLNVQAVDLKTFLLGSHLQQSKSTPTKLLKRSSSAESIFLLLARLICVLLTSLLLGSDSLSLDQNACDKALSLWNASHMFGYTYWSSITWADFTSAVKQLVLHITHSFRITMSWSWHKGLDVTVCLCCLAKRRYLHLSLVCLLINILIFLKRKNRFGILILLSWTLLSSLRYWEIFWLKAGCGWRVTGAAFCWLLGTCSFLFSLRLYSRVLRTKKKTSYRSQLTPRPPPSTEKSHASDSEALDTTNENEPSRDKTAAELDHNLNGLTLGLPTRRRRNGYNTHLSTRNSGTTGSFWNQSVDSNSKETPLFSMRQRPLIVPATLHFSGLQQGRFPTSHTRQATNVPRGPSSNSYGISDDDVSSSDTIDEENSIQNSSIDKEKVKKPRKTKRRIPAQSSKTGSTGFLSVKTFLLFVSVLLNVYFIVLFTEWPVWILHSFWKRFQG